MSTNNQTDEGKPKLSEEQKQKMKKYGVFALMGIIFVGCMWFIFAPSAEDKAQEQAQAGFNTDIPMPNEESMIGDKRDAYEQEQVRQKQAERMRSLSDFSALIGENAPQQSEDLALMTDEPAQSTGDGYTPRTNPSIQASTMAYNDINRTLGSFYETPQEDPEKEELKRQVEELQVQAQESENRKNSTEEQLALMEKSFQMAAKYMPGTTGTAAAPSGNVSEPATTTSGKTSGTTLAAPITQVREQTVSALLPEMSDAEFVRAYSQPRNMGFLTVAGDADTGVKNTIAACVHVDQTVTDGQHVRLRLLEPMQAGSMVIPRNAVLSAEAKIGDDRLEITVQSLESGGTIVPVSLTAYDLDGQSGIFIPNLQELNAAKEIVANMGSNAGTSISLSSDAGGQFAADMGRNLIQGVSQFASKKLREVKVHLKAGYRVLLLPNAN
ncbi:MAG: conjugative transposon protein TraM [Tannerellaceae bacterium]|jgi:conjugative transposon TraM protein|nr:conjugative transposon protein TraM [Tannerellaceae bacterium]